MEENSPKKLFKNMIPPEQEVPSSVPSLIEIKKILPKHCFQSNLAQSFYYVIKDVIIISIIYAAYVSIENSGLSFIGKSTF